MYVLEILEPRQKLKTITKKPKITKLKQVRKH